MDNGGGDRLCVRPIHVCVCVCKFNPDIGSGGGAGRSVNTLGGAVRLSLSLSACVWRWRWIRRFPSRAAYIPLFLVSVDMSDGSMDARRKALAQKCQELLGDGAAPANVNEIKTALFREYADIRQTLEMESLSRDSAKAELAELDSLRPHFRIVSRKVSTLENVFSVFRMSAAAVVFVCGGLAVCLTSPVDWVLAPILKRLGVSSAYFPEGLVVNYLFWRPLLAAALVDVKRDHSALDWDETEGGLVVINHASNLDGFVIGPNITPIMPKFLAKKELFFYPILGWMAWLSSHVVVNRKNRTKAVGALNDAVTRLLTGRKRSVFISPEGTRTRDGQLVLPFKKGAFHMQEQSQVPFFPTVVYGAYELWPPGRLFISPGEVVVKNLPTIPYKAGRSRDETRIMLQRFYLDLLYKSDQTLVPKARPLSLMGILKSVTTLALAGGFYWHFFSYLLRYLDVLYGITWGRATCYLGAVHALFCVYIALRT